MYADPTPFWVYIGVTLLVLYQFMKPQKKESR